MQDSMFIGLDVHKATISVAVADGKRGGEVRSWGVIPNRADDVRKVVEKLSGRARELHFCYEAGPCGYGLHRQLSSVLQFSAKVGFENSLVGGPFISFCRG